MKLEQWANNLVGCSSFSSVCDHLLTVFEQLIIIVGHCSTFSPKPWSKQAQQIIICLKHQSHPGFPTTTFDQTTKKGPFWSLSYILVPNRWSINCCAHLPESPPWFSSHLFASRRSSFSSISIPFLLASCLTIS